MSIHISKNRIRATGSDANGLLIAMASNASLLEMSKNKTGSPNFQVMVNEAIASRLGLSVEDGLGFTVTGGQLTNGETAPPHIAEMNGWTVEEIAEKAISLGYLS